MASRIPLGLNSNKNSLPVNTVLPIMVSATVHDEINAISPTNENVSLASYNDHNTIIVNNIFINDVGVIDFDTSWGCLK